jgi:hypothetical protein
MPDDAPPGFPEPGPTEAQLTLTYRLCPTNIRRQEPTARHTQATACVEDDRREDESNPARAARTRTRREAQRSTGKPGRAHHARQDSPTHPPAYPTMFWLATFQPERLIIGVAPARSEAL